MIVKLIGGLGNQMFQYAFGLSVSKQLGIKVSFDVHDLLSREPRANFTFRDFELGVFKAHVPIASNSERSLYVPLSSIDGYISSLTLRIRRKIIQAHRFEEKQQFVYDPEVLKVKRRSYFDGYWQNEKYFILNEKLIRQAFEFKFPLIGLNESLARDIANTVAVSMHIRRGDYITNPISNEVHGICTPEYYQRALNLIIQKVGKIKLFIFSDEPKWVEENLHFEVPTFYINHNKGKQSYIDMQLMSLCQHNIIANSSFSWWGAWLNCNFNKIVIAPQTWLQHKDLDTSDLIPPNWIRI